MAGGSARGRLSLAASRFASHDHLSVIALVPLWAKSGEFYWAKVAGALGELRQASGWWLGDRPTGCGAAGLTRMSLPVCDYLLAGIPGLSAYMYGNRCEASQCLDTQRRIGVKGRGEER